MIKCFIPIYKVLYLFKTSVGRFWESNINGIVLAMVAATSAVAPVVVLVLVLVVVVAIPAVTGIIRVVESPVKSRGS